MKYLIITVFSLISLFSFSQNKFITRNGIVSFEASLPSFEEVKATNKSVTAIINTENGEFAALVLVKGFRFKNALMEEHFNENYVESDKYPKATFKGKISDFDIETLEASKRKMTYNGTLEFHGKTKTLENLPLTLSKDEAYNIILSGTFDVNVDDFDIKIPKVVSSKLSKIVIVTFHFILNKK
jgi:polyisoprenoid-binding protein YceI